MSYPELLLSNQICFLVHRLDRAISARYRPSLDALGLTYPQYLAMMALWEHETLGIGELCTLLALDTGTVSPLVKRLESAGFVKKIRREEDERSVSVVLTESGRKLQESARPVPKVLSSCLLADEDEYFKLRQTLRTLIGRLETTVD